MNSNMFLIRLARGVGEAERCVVVLVRVDVLLLDMQYSSEAN